MATTNIHENGNSKTIDTSHGVNQDRNSISRQGHTPEASQSEPREATELAQLQATPNHDQDVSLPEARNTNGVGTRLHKDGNTFQILGLTAIWNYVAVGWRRQIAITVPHEACRDHWANERTFLAYLRTSLAFAIQAIIIAQLFRLQHSQYPNQTLGFYILGVPFAAICLILAVAIVLMGAYRFWRQQNAMNRGKCHAGGWELQAVGLIGLIATTALFAVLVAVNIDKELIRADSPLR